MPARTVILGIGKLSTQFTEKLINALIDGPKDHGIVAIGIYDNGNGVAGPKVRQNIHKRTRRLHVDDISVTPKVNVRFGNPRLDDLVDLRKRALDYAPNSLLLLIDAEFMRDAEFAEVFRQLRVRAIQLSMTAICFSDDSPSDQEAYAILERFTQPDQLNNNAPILESAFIVRTNASLTRSMGGIDTPFDLLAKTLAGIWEAPLYRNFNPDFDTQVTQVRQPGRSFIGLAVKTQGLSMINPKAQPSAQPQAQSQLEPPVYPQTQAQPRPGFFCRLFYPILRHTTRCISAEQAASTINALTRSILKDVPPVTTIQPFGDLGVDVHELPISVNIIVPFRENTKKFDDVANLIELKLTNYDPALADRGYRVVIRSIIKGRGIDLSKKMTGVDKGKFYCQVCVLFAVDRQHTSPAQISSSAQAGSRVNAGNTVQDRER